MRLNVLSWFKYIFGIHWKDLFLAAFIIIGFMGFLTLSTHALYARDTNSKDTLINKNNNGITLYDKNNIPFFTFYQGQPKNYTPISQIPESMKQAIIAAEDEDFYQHPGYSVKAIVRSAISNLQTGDLGYGGSTITQQLVKNSLLTPEKNFLRKYQEIVLAQRLEQQYSKDEILEMYLNTVYFGEGAYGIDAAAERYFNKEPINLTLSESSTLVGLLPAPSQLSPLNGDINKSQQRQDYVLSQMVGQGYITPEQKEQAKIQKLKLNRTSDGMNTTGAHFAIMVRDALVKEYGEEAVAKSGFKVYTSLDLNWQAFAEKTAKSYVTSMRGQGVRNGAIVIMDPKTGEVRSLVGSYDWFDETNGKVNAAIVPRQPGSAFKPIVYLTGLEKGIINPSTMLNDSPTQFVVDKGNPQSPVYKPNDFDGRFRGNVTVRRALANSLNIPTVEVMDKVGTYNTTDMAQRLGISSLNNPRDYFLSMALGSEEVSPLEMATAYSTLANQGYKNPATLYTKIVDKNDKVIYQYTPQPQKAVDEKYVYQISSILSDNQAKAEVFGNTLNISRTAAVKTGTTDDYKDAWTIGYTPSLVVGVWLGNNDHKPMNRIFGAMGAAPLWKTLIEQFSTGTSSESFNPPPGIVSLNVCRSNGLPVRGEGVSNTYSEYFVQGTEPTKYCIAATPTPEPSPGSASPSPTPPPNQQPPAGGADEGTTLIIINRSEENNGNNNRASRDRGRDD